MNYEKIDKYLGQKLFEARVVKRITQEQMADMISVKYERLSGRKCTRQAYAYYEKGDRSMPVDIFRCACAVLNLDWATIFNEALENCKEEI